MASIFEDALLRNTKPIDGFRQRLFHYLDDGSSLHRLRATSIVLHDLVDHQPGRLFRNLYVNFPFTHHSEVDSLEVIATFCHNLTIKIGYPAESDRSDTASQSRKRLSKRLSNNNDDFSRTRRAISRSSWPKNWRDSVLSVASITRASIQPGRQPTAMRDATDLAKARLQIVFLRCHQVHTLAVRVNGDPAWPGRTEIEDALVTLRGALEPPDLSDVPHLPPLPYLPKLTEIRLAPLHAMGLIHLPWTGMCVWGPPPIPSSSPKIWQRLHTLEIQLHNPFTPKLTQAQTTMTKKLLYTYLQSFTPTLHTLRFIWLGPEGPSPLLLHTEPGLEARSPLHWPKLQQLYVGGLIHPHRTIQLLPELAPHVDWLKTLRGTHPRGEDGKVVDVGDAGVWVEVLLGQRRSDAATWASNSSSIYSQSAARTLTATGTATNGGVSRSSRVVPFMLDLRGWQVGRGSSQSTK